MRIRTLHGFLQVRAAEDIRGVVLKEEKLFEVRMIFESFSRRYYSLFFVNKKPSNQLLSRWRSGSPSRCERGTSSWTTAPSAATTSRAVIEMRIMRREDRSILYALN